VADQNKIRYGGNTTCLRIDSACTPRGEWLVVDAGTGIVPLAQDFMKENGSSLTLLHTHYHHDHTQGFLLSAFPFLKRVPVSLWGPVEHRRGPRRIYEELMTSPHFPVEFRDIAGHIECHNIEYPNVTILVFHPQGGCTKIFQEDFDRATDTTGQISFGQKKYNLAECLVVKMHKSHHPEQTISFRFEEGPSKEVFVFLTDNENRDGVSQEMASHLLGADLLVADCQYTRKKYDTMTAGWGHGTPDHVICLAKKTGVKHVGLTHHDPLSSDDDIDSILATAQTEGGNEINVFACADYTTVDVSEYK
jgi:phosphoribosyl 1,2-cyclic phosphodiesterase